MSDSAATKSLFDKSRRPFLLRKLHSLTGVLPVGGFMVFADISHMPYLPLLEAGILLPLLFHALYGVKLALEGKPNVGRYTYSRNWMYLLQRTTGIIAFLFIGFHLYEYWGQKMLGKMAADQFYPSLCASMSSTVKGVPVVALVYVVGIAAATFHLANGLWGFCFSWGVTVSRRAQRLSATVFGVAGVLIFLLGANTAIYFATGSRFAIPTHLFGPAEAAAATPRTCIDVAPAPAPSPSPLAAP